MIGLRNPAFLARLTDTTPVPAASLSALVITGLQSGGNLPLEYTIDQTATIPMGIGTGAKPSVTQFDAGTDGDDVPLVDTFSVELTVGGSGLEAPFADGIDEAALKLWAKDPATNTIIEATAEAPGVTPFALDTTAPAATISGVQTGATTATISIDVTDEAGDVADIGVFPAAATPTEADIEAGTGAAWSNLDVALTAGDTNDQAVTGLTAETGYKPWAVLVDAQGHKTTISGATFTTAAAATFAATRLGGFQNSDVSTATPSFTFDTTGASVGQKVLLPYGTMQYATAATVNGNPATKRSVDAGNAGAGKLSVFEYTLQSGEIGPGQTVVFTIPAARLDHVFDPWLVPANAVFSDQDQAQQASGTTAVTVAPVAAGADNIVLVWAVGQGFIALTFSPDIEVQTAALANGRSMGVGRIEDVAAGSYSVDVTPDLSGDLGVVGIAMELI